MASLFIVRSNRDKQKLWDALKSTPLPWRITVRALDERTRSPDYNAYYWGILLARIAVYTGHDKQELHEYFKTLFLPLNPELSSDGYSSAACNISEFADYCEQIRAWALLELGLVIESAEEFFF